jgi:hypothetical protein
LDSQHVTTLSNWNGAFRIGQLDLARYPYKGVMDDFRIYGSALTAAEIRQLYIRAILYYPLDEGSGVAAYDASGNGYNGAITGASWVAGKYGNALSFSGTFSNYVSVPNLGIAGGPFAIAMWVKPASTGDYLTLCGCDYTHRLLLGSDGKLLTQSDGNFFSTGTIPYGAWSFVVYKFDGSTEYWYINGILDSQHVTTLSNWNGAFRIGQLDLARYPYKGVIDDFRIYGSALTAAEIMQLYTL